MIRIRHEEDLKNWFKKNHKKLGFEKIVQYDKMEYPDFIVLEKGKKTRIELEVFSSNFLLHKHDPKKVDKVVCVKKDVNLKVPVIELNNFQIVGRLMKSPYSYESQILKIIEKETVVTSSDISKMLRISWNTAENYLKELVISGDVERVKKEGVNLWLIK